MAGPDGGKLQQSLEVSLQVPAPPGHKRAVHVPQSSLGGQWGQLEVRCRDRERDRQEGWVSSEVCQ